MGPSLGGYVASSPIYRRLFLSTTSLWRCSCQTRTGYSAHRVRQVSRAGLGDASLTIHIPPRTHSPHHHTCPTRCSTSPTWASTFGPRRRRRSHPPTTGFPVAAPVSPRRSLRTDRSRCRNNPPLFRIDRWSRSRRPICPYTGACRGHGRRYRRCCRPCRLCRRPRSTSRWRNLG